MSLISIESVHKSYQNKTVLEDISFSINAGDRIGLIGENGAGKTTLFRIICGEETPDSGKVIRAQNKITGYLSQESGRYENGGFNALSSPKLKELEKSIRLKEKEISEYSGSFDSPQYRSLIDKYNEMISKFEALDGYSYEHNMRDILSGLNLPENTMTLPYKSLSGGEKMRVALAGILLGKPDILLLDEPTNHLDTKALQWLEKTLDSFSGGLVVISHDRYFLDKTTNKTAGIENKKIIIRNGNYTSYCQQAKNELAFSLREKERIEGEIKRQTEVKQTLLSHRNISGYHEREKTLCRLKDSLSEVQENSRSIQKAKLKLSFKMNRKTSSGEKLILKVSSLKKSYGDKVLFSDVSFEISSKDKVFITGPNGCGKSTLFSLFLGKAESFEGKIDFNENLTYIHMTQNINFADESLTLLEELMTNNNFFYGSAMSTLARFGFYGTDCQKKIDILSGGERSRLFLACALNKNPDILFLDEPTNHMDIPSREVLENALDEYNGAFISISHDRYFIRRCAGKILGFKNGKILEYENYEEYTDDLNKKTVIHKENKNNKKSGGSEKKGRALERKETAIRKQKISEIEKQINILESKLEKIKTELTPDSSPEKYSEYAYLMEAIEKKYEEYTSYDV